MGEFRGTEQIISAKQNQNIKEALTGASSILNIWRENREIVLKPKQEKATYSLLQRRDVMEILSTGFGKSMHDLYCLCYGQGRNILIENLYDHNFPSKKYYRQPDIGNVVAEPYSNGHYDRNSKFASRKSTSIFSITPAVLENNALQRTTLNGVRDCSRWVAYSRGKTHSIILHTILCVAWI